MNPVFKKGNKHLVSNYQPISLTCIIVKGLEQIIFGVMLALTQSTGSTPSTYDLLTTAARGAASPATPSFRRRGQMPSGQPALVVSNTDSSACNSEGDTIKLSKVSGNGWKLEFW